MIIPKKAKETNLRTELDSFQFSFTLLQITECYGAGVGASRLIEGASG
jgi:hypothetical protein